MVAFPNKVWTERETGDWEACVAASYAMGLLHGGIKMAAPYTQGEREKLEKVKDEPQNFLVTDAMSQAVYGHKLRPVTIPISQAVMRINVGLVLSGKGSPGRQWQAGFTGNHAVFYVPTSSASGYLGDPLAPNMQLFELITSSRIVAWATPDAREVKLNEFQTYSQAQYEEARRLAYNEGLKAAAAAVEAVPER